MGLSIQLRAALPASPHEVAWETVAEHGAKVRAAFAAKAPASFVRANRGECLLLQGRAAAGFARPPPEFPKLLARALADATVTGLPMRAPQGPRWHADGWDQQIRRGVQDLAGIELDPARTVGAYLCYDDPDLVPDVVRGRRVAWVLDGASRLLARLRDPQFREFYGFDERPRDLALDVPPVEGWLVDAEVRDRLERWRGEFDVAVFSAGPPAKLWCHYVTTALGCSAFDAGGLADSWLGRTEARPGLFGPRGSARRVVWPPDDRPASLQVRGPLETPSP